MKIVRYSAKGRKFLRISDFFSKSKIHAIDLKSTNQRLVNMVSLPTIDSLPTMEKTDSFHANGYGWAKSLPAACGLYDPEQERDSCGVGFIVNIKGQRSHSILHDASFILCNMTHRGAEGADIRDGDGAGVMYS
jgi:hypothetical protein